MFACEADDDSPAEPEAINISPNRGGWGTNVTVLTRNLPFNVLNDEVSFNGVKAEVIEATESQISVIVPEGAGSGPVAVRTGGKVRGKTPLFEYVLSTSAFLSHEDAPTDLAFDKNGNLFFIARHQIYKVTPTGSKTLVAGQKSYGFADGTGASAQFDDPRALAVDNDGNIYVADFYNHRIRKITPGGVVSTLAGSTLGYQDGPAGQAKFHYPAGVAVATDGSILVADSGNNRIRQISTNGIVSTVAGNGEPDMVDGDAMSASFNYPYRITVAPDGRILIINVYAIRAITTDKKVVTLAGGKEPGFKDGSGSEARFDVPTALVLDGSGNLLVADSFNSRIRKITPAGQVTTFAGVGDSPPYPFVEKFGTLDRAPIWYPGGIAISNSGVLFVSVNGNMIIKIN